MKKITVIFCFFLLIGKFSYGQADNTELREIIFSHLKFDNRLLKDSVALYTFSLKLEFSNEKKSFKVRQISSNDSLAYNVLKNIESLSTINFKKFFNSKPSALILPFAIIVSNHKGRRGEPMVPISTLKIGIEKLFQTSDLKSSGSNIVVYMAPFIIYTDTTQYD